MTYKQVIVMRADLRNKQGQKIHTGKLIAQACHAAMAFLTKRGKHKEPPYTCGNCNTEAVYLAEPVEYKTKILYNKELIDVTVPNLRIPTCLSCNAEWFTLREDEQVQIALAKTLGINYTFTSSVTPDQMEWMRNDFRKVVLKVNSEKELLDLEQACKDAGLEVYLIQDAGYTEFGEPTYTCLSIGPDRAEKIDPLTKGLSLL